MYPKINDMLQLLDNKGISTFLVTNAQFPECIQNLGPCTQLYVSIDAATRMLKGGRSASFRTSGTFSRITDALLEKRFDAEDSI